MRRGWLLALLLATTAVLAVPTCMAGPSDALRTQVTNWGESVVEVRVEYPPVVTAGESFPGARHCEAP